METNIETPLSGRFGLLAAKQITRTLNISRSHWHALVKQGKAPAPAIRDGVRFTRWRESDVMLWASDPAGWIAKLVAAALSLNERLRERTKSIVGAIRGAEYQAAAAARNSPKTYLNAQKESPNTRAGAKEMS